MKNIALFLFLFSSFCINAQTLEFNQYGEPKTKIYRSSAIQTWTNKLMDTDEAKLIEKLGSQMFLHIYNHSNLSQYPTAINEVKNYWNNETKILDYNVWFVAELNEGYTCIVRISPKDNGHMPSGFLPGDGSDFYMLVDHIGIENFSACSKGRKNKPDSYKNYFGANENVAVEQPGTVELNAGVEAFEKDDFTVAFDQFSKAADKGNTSGMLNLGYMYYYNKVPKTASNSGYSTSDVLNQTLNAGKELEERKQKAFAWYKKSAEAGHRLAMYELGILYSKGDGTNKDLVEARKWLQKSYDAGYTEAKVELDKL